MNEKEIEQNIREQMLALESQMKRLQEWRDTGYSATVCDDEGPYATSQPESMHGWLDIDTVKLKEGISIVSQCKWCGIKRLVYYDMNDTYTYADEWSEFREGGEEE
tara:strand:+ start:404 stop:721 length:318 start_codon:yes stop_codon:yes gene_type:complete